MINGIKTLLITGGPSSGKTTIINDIAQEFSDDVVVVPESATLLLNGKFPPPGDDVEMLWCFQRAIFHLTQQLEQAFAFVAKNEGKKLLVCDRGRLGGAAYVPGGLDTFAMALGIKNINQHMSVYDHCLFLHSIAVDHPELWQQDAGNQVRLESDPAVAAELDRSLWNIWQSHPSFESVHAEHGGVAHKLAHAEALIKRLLSD